jgi:hypothetical protein
MTGHVYGHAHVPTIYRYIQTFAGRPETLICGRKTIIMKSVTFLLSACFTLMSMFLLVADGLSSGLTSEETTRVIIEGLRAERALHDDTPFSFLEPQPATSLPATSSLFLGSDLLAIDRLPDQAFSEKSRSYLFSLEKGTGEPYVGMAKLHRVDVNELKTMSIGEYRAEFMVGYSIPSFGNILVGKGMQYERPGDALPRLQDGGWRLRFLKKF